MDSLGLILEPLGELEVAVSSLVSLLVNLSCDFLDALIELFGISAALLISQLFQFCHLQSQLETLLFYVFDVRARLLFTGLL